MLILIVIVICHFKLNPDMNNMTNLYVHETDKEDLIHDMDVLGINYYEKKVNPAKHWWIQFTLSQEDINLLMITLTAWIYRDNIGDYVIQDYVPGIV